VKSKSGSFIGSDFFSSFVSDVSPELSDSGVASASVSGAEDSASPDGCGLGLFPLHPIREIEAAISIAISKRFFIEPPFTVTNTKAQGL
jgi:hypothetical protein